MPKTQRVTEFIDQLLWFTVTRYLVKNKPGHFLRVFLDEDFFA